MDFLHSLQLLHFQALDLIVGYEGFFLHHGSWWPVICCLLLSKILRSIAVLRHTLDYHGSGSPVLPRDSL